MTAPAEQRRRPRWGVIGAGAIGVSLLALWIYAFLLAPSGNPDHLENRAWVEQAEAACAVTRAELASLPQASDAESPADRADALDAATGRVADMVEAIGKIPNTDADDRVILDQWFADWPIYLADRRAHADRLRTEGDVQFLVSLTAAGAGIDEKLIGLTRVNDFESCAPPEDVS